VDGLHVVIDRNLITGQNDESVVTAVQNLILFCSQRWGSYLSTSDLLGKMRYISGLAWYSLVE